MGVTYTVIDDIKTKLLIWTCTKKAYGRIPKQVLVWIPTGRRRRGRPRKIWREGINKEIEDRNISEYIWKGGNSGRVKEIEKSYKIDV